MSNLDTMLKNTSANQDLFVDLNEKSAETISGGRYENGGGRYKVFKIRNNSQGTNPYAVDGVRTQFPYNLQTSFWVTDKRGIIEFDYDYGRPGVQLKRYTLLNGRKYEFRRNTRTAYRHDIDLYDVGRL
ncbi:MAG: hypothetical protein QNJ63_31270 [Calothrix sp. MO_192.B10]|nr:hypothetical protein [Calothrix sp. MO_192.B10]